MDTDNIGLPSAPLRVLLLGASGFLGSHVRSALLARGVHLTSVCRRLPYVAAAFDSAPSTETWQILHVNHMLVTADWLPHLEQIDVVINCVGILRQRIGELYNDVHHLMPQALAGACKLRNIRLIHTSALGLHADAKSRFLSSKLHGEQAIMGSGADYCIVRPSLIDGIGGFGASWLRMLATWPVHFVPRGATGMIAAVQATDLGEAYAALAHVPTLEGYRQANLGGSRLFSYREYLQLLRGVEHGNPPTKPAIQLQLPNWVTRIGSHLCDLFRFSPFSYGHWILLQRDNVPMPNSLPELLGREPTAVTYQRISILDDFRLS